MPNIHIRDERVRERVSKSLAGWAEGDDVEQTNIRENTFILMEVP